MWARKKLQNAQYGVIYDDNTCKSTNGGQKATEHNPIIK